MGYSRIVQNFLKLSQIESLSFEEKRLANYLATSLKRLGFKVVLDSAGKKIGGNCGNLIARLKGSSKAPRILFNAHMDTVSPAKNVEPQIKKGIIKSDGTTILGADDKAGAAILLELAHVMKEQKLAHGDVTFVFTVAEEKGLLGSKNLNLKRIKADFGYVLDCDGKAGKIIVCSPSQNSIKAKFFGRAAHAGVCPEKGINAVQAASKAVAKMKLGRIDKETTVNIGVITGGLAGNIVPAECEVEGETRSFSLSKLKVQTDKMTKLLKISAKEARAKVKVEVGRAYNSFSVKKADKAVRLAQQGIKRGGFRPQIVSTGGGSDANIFNEAGITCVGLSVGVENPHSTEEKIKISDLENSAKIAVEIVKEASQQDC